MGRYDRIRVYHNGQWKQPTRIRRYYYGTWQDLGDNNSSNTVSMYVRNSSGASKRATLNRQDYDYIVDQWAQGSFSLIPAYGFQYCTYNTDGATNRNWYFSATIRKTQDVDQNVFRCSATTGSFIEVKWLADGRIYVHARYGSNGYHAQLYSSNAIGANNNVYLYLHCNANNSGREKFYIEFNGVTTAAKLSTAFAEANSKTSNIVGDTYMQFRNTLTAAGCGVEGTIPYSVSFNASTASGSDGSQYTGVNHQVSRNSGTNWI